MKTTNNFENIQHVLQQLLLLTFLLAHYFILFDTLISFPFYFALPLLTLHLLIFFALHLVNQLVNILTWTVLVQNHHSPLIVLVDLEIKKLPIDIQPFLANLWEHDNPHHFWRAIDNICEIFWSLQFAAHVQSALNSIRDEKLINSHFFVLGSGWFMFDGILIACFLRWSSVRSIS